MSIPKKQIVPTQQRHKKGLRTDPRVYADVRERKQAGETLQSIANTYGVSREYIRQLCEVWGFTGPTKKDKVKEVIKMLENGETTSLNKACQTFRITKESAVRCADEELGFDLALFAQDLKDNAMADKANGRTFGWWAVVDGSYRNVKRPSSGKVHSVVTCRCRCGTERDVAWRNLINGFTRGCGCRSTKDGDGRVVVPWRCRETGVQLESTAAAARYLGICNMTLMRRMNRGEPHIDDKGRTWLPVPEDSSSWQDFIVDQKGQEWICLDTGETWSNAVECAKSIGISSSGLGRCFREGRTYCSTDHKHYCPTAHQDELERSPWRQRLPQQTPGQNVRRAS